MLFTQEGDPVFPLGMYEQPRDAAEWAQWAKAGVNLLRCHTEEDLDRAHSSGMMGWVPVPMIVGDHKSEEALEKRVRNLRDHPALQVWEAPDEAIWNACRLEDGRVSTRLWSLGPSVKKSVFTRLEAVVEGLRRGSALVRRLDGSRKIWLNEACKSDQDTLARCLPFLDIVGFDYYPVPESESKARALPLIGRYVDRFRRTAPSHEIWVVEQAFSWSTIRPEDNRRRAYPTLDQFRFMAWDAVAHGATGLLWWGSHHEDRPAAFLAHLMKTVSELSGLQSFLVSGEAGRISVEVDNRQNPALVGVSYTMRRSGDEAMLVLANEDRFEHDVMIRGVERFDLGGFQPLWEDESELEKTSEGWIVKMKGLQVRVYVG